MSDSKVGTCPACGRDDVPINQSGTLRKHTFEGEPCEGRTPAGATGPEMSDSAEAGEQDEWTDDPPETGAGSGADDDRPPAVSKPDVPQPPTAAQAPRDEPGVYRWQMTVQNPAIYLTDPEWHYANGEMAARKAAEAGHTVTGEAQWDGGVGGGHEPGTVLLTYLVPVAS